MAHVVAFAANSDNCKTTELIPHENWVRNYPIVYVR